ncbi:MAG: UpxY family transcription antiterminator [Bacteroidales bacterium]|nr:UpxY family transcription antiterminator [Bacteroidales bacterium]
MEENNQDSRERIEREEYLATVKPAPGNRYSGTSHSKAWYALYVRSRNEKKVNEMLNREGIETYLPLLKTLKQWSDRKKWVQEPLFKSYLFVHIEKQEYMKVLQTDGVVRYITFEGKAVPVPPQQILAIKQFLNKEEDPEILSELFEAGDHVEITRGSLRGLTGNLIDFRGKQKVQIEIESIGKSIYLTIPKSYLKVVSPD